MADFSAGPVSVFWDERNDPLPTHWDEQSAFHLMQTFLRFDVFVSTSRFGSFLPGGLGIVDSSSSRVHVAQRVRSAFRAWLVH